MSEPPFDDPDLDRPTDDLDIPVEQDFSGAETNESQILGGDDEGGEDDPADHLPDPHDILDQFE
ncbi:MAG: hypothetical protein U0R27_00170 [Candidatus Nanopelagicales bacterium]